MSAQTLLSGGDKWFSYSGEIFGDVSAPATISMILIPNTGLKDSLVQITPYFGQPVSASANTGLGIAIKLDDVTIYKTQAEEQTSRQEQIVSNTIPLFIPRQSKLEIISLNTSGNNTQIRGANLLGYYL
tara:strand:+ start:19 stop:405 length:387 start_codon:yes stop_codon:yes gene_type:complete